MRRNPRLFRLSANVALIALLSNSMLPLAAVAQPAQPEPSLPDQNRGDPPARVGRVAGIEGQVSYRTSGDTEWSAASLNYPVSSGYAAWTQPSATANLEVSACRIVLAGTTEFQVTSLDTGGLQAVAAQGETYMHLRDLAPNEVWSVQTPRGLVRLTGGGRYGIVAGTTEQPTLITVVDGVADIEGPNLSLQVNANQTATVTGTDSFLGSIGPIQRDSFLNAQLAAEQPAPQLAAAIPRQVVAMPGGGDLIATGSWSEAPQYGQVWYPPVSPGWAPYRPATGLCGAVGLDLGGRRALGLRAVPLRPLAGGRRTLGVDAGRGRGGRTAGVRPGLGDLHRHRRGGRGGRGAGSRGHRLDSARPAGGVPSLVSCLGRLCPAGEHQSRYKRDEYQ